MFIDMTPLKHSEFRKLFLSQWISLMGSQMTMVTIPFQIYALTKSTFLTGLVSTVELVCLIFTVFWGGVLADSIDKRKLLVISEMLMAGLVVLLGFNALLPEPSLWVIFVLSGLLAGVNGIHRPAFEALTPLLIPSEELSKVSALTMLKMVSASLIGPALAGFLVASLGPILTYGLDFLSFAFSLALLMKLAIPVQTPEERVVRGSILREILEGISYLKSRKDILGSYVVDFFAMVFCMPQVLFPAIAQMYDEEKYLGFLYGSVAGGSVLISLLSRWTTGIVRLGIGIACVAAGWAASISFAGLGLGFWAVALGLFLAGAFDGLSGIFRLTMWNESIPTEFRGRLASFGMLSYMSGPLLGNTVMGFLASSLGVNNALIVGGLSGLGMVIISAGCLPEFRGYASRK